MKNRRWCVSGENRGVFILEEHSGGCQNFAYVFQRCEIRFRQEPFWRVEEKKKAKREQGRGKEEITKFSAG